MPLKDPVLKKAYHKKYYKEKGDKVRMQVRVHRYGMTIDEWNKMFEDQGCVCAACGSPTPGGGPERNQWNTDHDHETGKVRGILCWDCNRIAGSTQDHTIRIRLVLNYLEKFYGGN